MGFKVGPRINTNCLAKWVHGTLPGGVSILPSFSSVPRLLLTFSKSHLATPRLVCSSTAYISTKSYLFSALGRWLYPSMPNRAYQYKPSVQIHCLPPLLYRYFPLQEDHPPRPYGQGPAMAQLPLIPSHHLSLSQTHTYSFSVSLPPHIHCAYSGENHFRPGFAKSLCT